MPDANVESAVVLTAVQVHKPQLRGAPIAEWVKRSAGTYRRVMGESGKFQRGFRPSKWLEWLNAGQPGAKSGPVRAVPEGDTRELTDEERAAKRKAMEEREVKAIAERERRAAMGQSLEGK